MTKGVVVFVVAVSISQRGLASPVENAVQVSHSEKNDVSPPLRDLVPPPVTTTNDVECVSRPLPDPSSMPSTTLNFDGISEANATCTCAPPSANGAVGATQYVQAVNIAFQVFNKVTGLPVTTASAVSSLWSGFGGACQNSIAGDPIVLYDQLASRWVFSTFASSSGLYNYACVAVSQTSDAAGPYYRYAFLLSGSNNFNLPKLAVWPDAYYLSMDTFDSTYTTFLGPQAFALQRSRMLTGLSATVLTTGVQSTAYENFLPANLDGNYEPPLGAPIPFLSTALPMWTLFRFHVDFAVPANTTFTVGGTLAPASYAVLCPSTRNCVPQLGTADGLDGLGKRAMDRLAYRRFGNGFEALVGNKTVDSGGIARIRWWEMTNVTSGVPTFVQESTYQPDSVWRWAGSAAMDAAGDLAIGFSASSASIFPQIRYAGRLATDPTSALSQGEATLIAGTGSQTLTNNRWGDYTNLSVDPVDGCTFWYTGEYYTTTATSSWKTRIGSFQFPSCAGCVTETTKPVVTPPASTTVTQTTCAP